jgi:hypothetical protein
MASSPVPTSSSFFFQSEKGLDYAGNAGHSRSTSAGSVPSDSQDSADLQKSNLQSPLDPGNSLGLPEYDYPTPWSIEHAQLPEIEYPAPFVVKNTFIGFDVVRPASLAEFFEERRTQSCPASAISLPPGLEDVIEPEEAAANLVAAENALWRRQAADDAHWAENNMPIGRLNSWADDEAGAPACISSWAPPQSDARVSLQLSHALQAPSEPNPMQTMLFAAQAPSWQLTSEPVLGSLEMPTMGSQGHYVGTCKPCAFFHTKGCGNGVQCPFCHLCDASEKKKRAKERRDALRAMRRDGC